MEVSVVVKLPTLTMTMEGMLVILPARVKELTAVSCFIQKFLILVAGVLHLILMSYHSAATQKLSVVKNHHFFRMDFQPLVLPVIIQIRPHLHAVYKYQVLPHHHRGARPWYRQKW